ncbi:PASTA domain-containing protein [Candidatus Dependentiae bacterium]
MKKINNSFIFILLPFLSFILGYYSIYIFFQKKYVNTPNLIGKNILQGINSSSEKNISLQLLKSTEDPDLPEGTILNQIPSHGQKIRPNQSIFLITSRKPANTLAPNFLEKNYTYINEYSKKNSINTKIIWIKNFYPNNLCIAQDPSENQEYDSNGITTYISEGNCVLYVVPNFKGCKISDLKKDLSQENIKISVFHINNVDTNHDCINCKIIDQKPMPGSIVDLNKTLYLQLQI